MIPSCFLTKALVFGTFANDQISRESSLDVTDIHEPKTVGRGDIERS